MPRNPQNHQAVSVSRTSQKVMLDEPLETPMKKLIFPDAPKKVCSDTVEKTVKVESVVDAGRLRKAGASVVGIGVDQVVHVSPSFQKVIQDDPFTTLTNELIDFQDIHKEVSADAVEKMVKVENVRQSGAAVAGTGIDQAVPVSATNQKVMLEEPLATLTKELDQSRGIHTKVCVDTVEKRMQSEDLVKNLYSRCRQGETGWYTSCWDMRCSGF